MKKQERHELASNELMEMLSRWSEWLRPYVSHILIGLVLVAAAGFFIHGRLKTAEQRSTRAPFALAEAMNARPESPEAASGPTAGLDAQVDALRAYVEGHEGGGGLGTAARKVLADRLYNRAVVTWASAGEATRVQEDLASAGELYERLSMSPDPVGPHAEYGLACVLAMKGDREAAEGRLVDLAQRYPDSVIEGLANDRLHAIRNPEALEFAPEEAEEEGDRGEAGEERSKETSDEMSEEENSSAESSTGVTEESAEGPGKDLPAAGASGDDSGQ